MGCEHERRWGWGFQPARISEARLLQPAGYFRKREGIPLSRVNEHVDGKDQGRRRPSPIVVGHEFTDSNRATGRQGGKGLAQQPAASLASFAMENMADRGDLVAAAKIRFQEIACHRSEPVTDTLPPGHL